MFPRPERLKTSRDIITVLRTGSRRSSSRVAVSVLPHRRSQEVPHRIAVIVDKKLSKKAVVRNLVRRRIRAILHDASLPQGYDIIVRTNPQAATATYSELCTEITGLLSSLARRS